jgi:hypothetical protein
MITALGRLLTALGVLWMGWAIVTGLLRVQPDISLPFLPGLLFFFVGRAMTRAGRRESLDDAGQSSQESQMETPAPSPRRRQVSRPATETRFQPEPETPTDTLPVIPDLEKAILDPPPPMTSEEMVAEARRQFGPRPFDDEDD